VGRLNANKDPLTVLAGFERSLAAIPFARLTMVFDAEDLLPEVRSRLATSPSLRGRVHLAGRVPWPEMPAYYSAADFFLLGSAHEGSGYAVIEACACGAAPIVTDIPSFRALTGGAAVGRLWQRGDADALARAIVEAASEDACAGRRRVRDHFERHLSWPAIGTRGAGIYADVHARRLARAQAR
jgi:glycosyltransferase involved in cell wall biosynthesis